MDYTHIRIGASRGGPIGSVMNGIRWLLPAILVLVAACGSRGGNGEPAPPPPPPDLSGVRIMLLPVRAPSPEQLDAELAFRLTQRSPTTDWVLPETLQAAADRAPAWRLRLDRIQRPVSDLGSGDRRLRDPLYSALRQLGAVVDSDYAVVPVQLLEAADSSGTELALVVAVVDIRGGRVLWLHTVRSGRNPSRADAVASLAELVARTLIP